MSIHTVWLQLRGRSRGSLESGPRSPHSPIAPQSELRRAFAHGVCAAPLPIHLLQRRRRRAQRYGGKKLASTWSLNVIQPTTRAKAAPVAFYLSWTTTSCSLSASQAATPWRQGRNKEGGCSVSAFFLGRPKEDFERDWLRWRREAAAEVKDTSWGCEQCNYSK